MRANVFLAERGPKSSRNTRIVHDFEGQNIFQILQSYVGKEEELKGISTDMYLLQKYILENDPGEGTSWWEVVDKKADENRARSIGMYLKRLQKSQNVTLGTTKAEDIVNKTGEFQTLVRKQRDLNAAVTLANKKRRPGRYPGNVARVNATNVDKETAKLAALAASTSVDIGGDVNATLKDGSQDTTVVAVNQQAVNPKDVSGQTSSDQTIAQTQADVVKVVKDVANNPKDTTTTDDAEAEAARKAEADTEARIRAEVEAEHKARAQANSKLEIQARAQEQDDAEEATAISRHEKIQKAEAARKAQAEAKKAELAGRREAMKQAWLHDDLSKITNADDLKKAQGMYSDRAGGFTSGGPPRIKGEEPNLLKYVQGQRINQDTGKWEQKKPVVSKWKDPNKDVEGGRD